MKMKKKKSMFTYLIYSYLENKQNKTKSTHNNTVEIYVLMLQKFMRKTKKFSTKL